ncbi:MAG: serine/threonine-protein kinase [Planctomycetaceae bacterium]
MATPARILGNDAAPAAETRPSDSCADCFCPHGGLVAKSSIEFREQDLNLLRSRLRSTAILLFALLAAHLVRFALTQGETFSFPATDLAPYLFVTSLQGLCIVALCAKHRPKQWALRLIEFVMFVGPALMLAHVQAQIARTSTVTGAEAMGTRLLAFSVPWMLLLMVYSLFIPNTWRRATSIVTLFALGPIATVFWATADQPGMWRELYDSGVLSFNLLQMITAAVVAVWGAHRFGTLRREAFDLKHVGVYTLLRRLGGGGMGDVYLAEHRLLKRPCAVKLIRRDRETDEQTITRFQNEVQATARLTHPNTVEIYDYGVTDNGMFFYVMEYLPGMSVQELVERTGPLPAARVIHLLRQVCQALDEAHRAGLIHRDIKPGNIFAAERGGIHDFAKLLDFGLVKSTGARDESIQHTRDGVVVGSPLYAAPETAFGNGVVDARVDLYSLGATAYFMLTGHPVFPGNRALDIVFAHAKEKPVPPSKHVAVPPDLEQVVLRCLEKDPADRYGDVRELERALAGCRDTQRWSSQAAADWWRQDGQEALADTASGSDPAFAVTTIAAAPIPASARMATT